MSSEDPADAELAEVVADGLNMRGFTVYEPASDKRFLKIINTHGVLADVLIAPDGTVNWEYRPFAGSPHGPDLIAAIVLAILDAPASAAVRSPVAQQTSTTLKELLDRTAADHGLSVTVIVYERDETSPENAYSETRISNPARPERGEVLAADDGGIWWTCRLHDPSTDEHGIEAAELASTIARALTLPSTTGTAPPAAA
jgi:hypothetical protein